MQVKKEKSFYSRGCVVVNCQIAAPALLSLLWRVVVAAGLLELWGGLLTKSVQPFYNASSVETRRSEQGPAIFLSCK